MSQDLTLLRQLQLLETEILCDVVKVCDENGISYTLSCGTLLGAVRHKGFIPWDDDIDVEIPINDYRRFLELAQEALGDKYFVQNYMTEPNWNMAYTRIRRNNTTMMDPYHSSYRIHHGVWIDIFPLVPVNKGFGLSLKKKWLSLSNFVQIGQKVESHEAEFKKMLGPVGMFMVRTFSKLPIKTRQRIQGRMLNKVFNAKPEKCEFRTYVWGNITKVLPKEIYEGGYIEVPFEGNSFKAPNDYKKYLEIIYGDYMTPPPEDQRRGHGNIIIDLENSYEKYMDTIG